jgi:DNA modification methylase
MRIEKLHNGRIVLVQGDCLEVLPRIKPKSIDAVITDIPSGKTKLHWDSLLPLDQMWQHLNRIKRPATPVVLLGLTQPATSFVTLSNLLNFKYEWIWEKSIPGGFANAHRQPLRCHENILVFYDEQCYYDPIKQQSISDVAIKSAKLGRVIKRINMNHVNSHNYGTVPVDTPFNEYVFPTSVQFFSSVPRQHLKHETEKPLDLMVYLVQVYTKEHDIVLDFTSGSGTTIDACIKLNRRCIAIEKDEHYFNVGLQRAQTAISMRELAYVTQ